MIDQHKLSGSIDAKNNWMYFLLSALVVLPLIFILGIVLGVSLTDGTGTLNQDISAWISSLATVAIAILTVVLSKETWELKRAQFFQIEMARKNAIKPILEFSIDSVSMSEKVLEFRISNNGHGTAEKISVSIAPLKNHETVAFDYIDKKLSGLCLIKNGISSLQAQSHRDSVFFSFNEYKEDKETLDCPFKVNFTYQDIEGTEYTNYSIINIHEFLGIKMANEPMVQISKSLRKISEKVIEIK